MSADDKFDRFGNQLPRHQRGLHAGMAHAMPSVTLADVNSKVFRRPIERLP